MGFRSVNAAEQHLRALEKKVRSRFLGRFARPARARYAFRPAAPPGCSNCRSWDASRRGAPILAEENLQGHYQVDPTLHAARRLPLRVRGLSMRDVGILEGDLLAVPARRTPRSGQIIVVAGGGAGETGVTVKHCRRRGHAVTLEAEKFRTSWPTIDIDLRREAARHRRDRSRCNLNRPRRLIAFRIAAQGLFTCPMSSLANGIDSAQSGAEVANT